MTAVAQQPIISANDRLTFTVFLALALHLVVLLGVGISAPDPIQAPTSLEVILAQHKSNEAPEEADFLTKPNSSF